MERKNYLIDTNVAIYYFGLALSKDAEKFLDQVLSERYFISVINRIELLGFKQLNGNESDALASFVSKSNIFDLEEDIILKNIEASVVHELNAPLLLGQSALNRFKSITFDYVTNTLVLNKSESEENQYKLTYNTDLICLERNIYYKPDDAIIIDKVTIDGSNTDKKNVSFIKFTNKTGYQLKYVELEFSILNSTMMEIWKSTIIVETTIKNMEYFEYKLEKPILIRENEKFVLSVNDWDIKM